MAHIRGFHPIPNSAISVLSQSNKEGLTEPDWKMLSHPSPTCRRPNYISLDSSWQKDLVSETTNLYIRTLPSPVLQEGERFWLRFNGVDHQAEVYLNGNRVGEHRGGFTPFSLDVTDELIPGENEIKVKVVDTTSSEQLLGKQSWREPHLCWYGPTVGIWKQVWGEVVHHEGIREIHLKPDATGNSVTIDADFAHEASGSLLSAKVTCMGEEVAYGVVKIKDHRGRLTLDLDCGLNHERKCLWSPEHPDLYEVELTVERAETGELLDKAQSYFALRDLRTRDGRVLLNGEQFYQNLVLEQAFYPEMGFSSPSIQTLWERLKDVKEMGFNGLRLHQTVVDPQFLSICDRLGLVVWAEMPSFYKFSQNATFDYMRELGEFWKVYRNHPSVICWVLFNESWGLPSIQHDRAQQNLTVAMYHLMKSLDGDERFVVANDGWQHTLTDLVTIHDYNSSPDSIRTRYKDLKEVVEGNPSLTASRPLFADGFSYSGQPLVLSEYGGVKTESEPGSWGYGEPPKNKKEALRRIEELARAVRELPTVLGGSCYTQLMDVEQETNGLMAKDGQVKYEMSELRKIFGDGEGRGFVFA